jgi:hypothetical protein
MPTVPKELLRAVHGYEVEGSLAFGLDCVTGEVIDGQTLFNRRAHYETYLSSYRASDKPLPLPWIKGKLTT